jgi:hypothetical protein
MRTAENSSCNVEKESLQGNPGMPEILTVIPLRRDKLDNLPRVRVFLPGSVAHSQTLRFDSQRVK